MTPHGTKLCEMATKCHRSALCMLWYLVVLFTGVTLLATSMDGGLFKSLTGADRFAEVFRGIVLPGADSSLHIPGTRLYGASVIQFRKHVDCFSKSGRWIYDPKPRHIVPNLFSDNYARQCDSRFRSLVPGAVDVDTANQIVHNGTVHNATTAASAWTVREELKWDWQSDEVWCPLLPFNREELCRMIGPKHNMLIIGDSINQQIFWTMLNYLVVNRSEEQLVKKGWGGLEWSFQGHEVCADVLGGPGQGFSIGYVRNDRLTPILHRADDRRMNFYELPWISFVDAWNVSVFLLNRGAHFEDDANVTQALTNVFSIISSRWPTARVFYRSSPPGHVNCTDHHEPLKERDSYERLSQFTPRHFHWGEFPRQNEIARRLTERFGYTFLDLDPIIALRADAINSRTVSSSKDEWCPDLEQLCNPSCQRTSRCHSSKLAGLTFT